MVAIKVIAFDLQGTLADHTDPLSLFPEVKECLKQLRSGYVFALVTEGRDLENVTALVAKMGLNGCFDLILHLKGTSLHKADGTAFQQVMKHFHISAKELLVVGDVPQSDILGARKVGSLAVRMKRGKFQSLLPRSVEEVPDYELDSLHQLLPLLKSLSEKK